VTFGLLKTDCGVARRTGAFGCGTVILKSGFVGVDVVEAVAAAVADEGDGGLVSDFVFAADAGAEWEVADFAEALGVLLAELAEFHEDGDDCFAEADDIGEEEAAVFLEEEEALGDGVQLVGSFGSTWADSCQSFSNSSAANFTSS